MKTLVLCLCILCLYSCNITFMAATHPEYSFVRLNEAGFTLSDCAPDITDCLPVYQLTDLQFQIINDERSLTPPNYRFLVAALCQDGFDSGANIFTDLFSNTKIDGIGLGVASGKLRFGTFTSQVGNVAAGDVIFAEVDGIGSPNDQLPENGFHKVTAVDSAYIYTNTDYSVAANPGSWISIWKMPENYIIAPVSQRIANGSEFSGTNYVFNFNYHTSVAIPYEVGDCFNLCVYEMEMTAVNSGIPSFGKGEYMGSTNCFEVVDSVCFNTKLEYGCNEDAFGFYGQGFFNSIRLPLYLSRANYESDEKGYQKSDGTFVKLAERVNKTFELRTDWMPEQWHDRLRVALSCDTIQVTNENENLTQVAIYKKDEYEVDWDSEVDFPLAKGKAKVFKGLFRKSVNSNCV